MIVHSGAADGGACSASTASVLTPTTSRTDGVGKCLGVVTPIRRPVNEPGPTATATSSIEFGDQPASASKCLQCRGERLARCVGRAVSSRFGRSVVQSVRLAAKSGDGTVSAGCFDGEDSHSWLPGLKLIDGRGVAQVRSRQESLTHGGLDAA